MSLIKPQMAIWIRIAFLGHCLTSTNTILFSLIYGRKNFKDILESKKSYIIILYSISAIFSIGILLGIMNFSFSDLLPNYGFIFNNMGFVFILFLLGCDLIALMNLEKTYRQVMHKRGWTQYSTIVLIVAIAFRLLVYSLSISYHYIQMSIMVIVSITLILSNFCIFFPVLKSESKPNGVYVGRAIIDKSYTLLLTGIYLLILGLLEKIIKAVGENTNFFLSSVIAFFIIFILILIIMSKSLKKRFQSFIGRNFYKNKYDYRLEWENFSKRVFSILNMRDLLQEVLSTVSETIGADDGFIMLLDERKKEFFIAAPKLDEQKLEGTVISANNAFLDWLWRYGYPLRIVNGKFILDKTFSDPPDIPNFILVFWETESDKHFEKNIFCVPIISENKLISIMILSCQNTIQRDIESKKKLNNLEIRHLHEDMDILETMSNQISIAIMNAKRSQELALSEELESFYRLSSMLLHDLKNSASMLSLVVQNATNHFDNPEFQKDALNTLSNVVNKIQRIISRLSSTPQKEELQNVKSVDLVEVINKAISLSGIREMARIKVIEKLDHLPIVELDPENIERVILNLILNAVESIEKDGTITIKTTQISSSSIQISISDTGCGMSQEFIREKLFRPFQTTKNKGLGIGLYQCKAIIDSYNGVIDIQSQQGFGSIFTIELPIINYASIVESHDRCLQPKTR